MLKWFLFILIIFTLNKVRTALITFNNDEKIIGSKRRYDGEMDTLGEPKAKVKTQQEQAVMDCLIRVLCNFNVKKLPEYENDSASNFFDRLIRRSLSFNIAENAEISLWEMPFTFDLTLEWHTVAFFLVLINNYKIDEDVLVEYFEFLLPKWTDKTLRTVVLEQVFTAAIDKLFLDLFEEALKAVNQDDKMGIEILLLLKKRIGLKTPNETAIWQSMCTKTIKKFPETVYDPQLRIENFNGENLVIQGVFIHFLPILRNLMIETWTEFEFEQEPFDFFVLFRLGDLEAKLPMGPGGLKVINQMFLWSRINLSAFKLEIGALKLKLIERLFDALFLGLEMLEIMKILFEFRSFSIFESYLKYSTDLNLNATVLYDLLKLFFEKCVNYNDFNFILALIAYVNIPKTVWNELKSTFKGQPPKIIILNQYESISQALSIFNARLDLKTKGSIGLRINGVLIDRIAEARKQPVQLETARIFLARVCGIPIEMTVNTEYCTENFEWSETVGFINFHVERIAGIVGYHGDIIKFTW